MGGFARYPWPQYISNAPFVYNKHYMRAVGLTFFCGFVNFLWFQRYLANHTVLLNIIKQINPGYGSFIDPESIHAPEPVKLV